MQVPYKKVKHAGVPLLYLVVCCMHAWFTTGKTWGCRADVLCRALPHDKEFFAVFGYDLLYIFIPSHIYQGFGASAAPAWSTSLDYSGRHHDGGLVCFFGFGEVICMCKAIFLTCIAPKPGLRRNPSLSWSSPLDFSKCYRMCANRVVTPLR
jgi:hypothetical protein